jgi:D-glycero-alpha-D-manno-heptose-7-phosphate kinase
VVISKTPYRISLFGGGTNYGAALSAGAKGGKLLGAGGEGMVFWAKPENHGAILSALDSVVHAPIHIDRMGSRIVFFQPEGI